MKKEKIIKGLKVVYYEGNYVDDYNDEIGINNQLVLFFDNNKYKIALITGSKSNIQYLYENENINDVNLKFEQYDLSLEMKYERLINCYDGYFFTPFLMIDTDIDVSYCNIQ